MVGQNMLVITLVLGVAVAQADNCETWSTTCDANDVGCTPPPVATYMFKESLTDEYCTTHDKTAASCGQPCCEKKDICYNWKNEKACADNKHVYDTGKAGTTSKKADFADKCCTDAPQCKDFSCGDGWKAIEANKDNYCVSKPCTDAQCCEVDPDTCAGHQTAGTGTCTANSHQRKSGTDDEVINGAMNFVTKCCETAKTCSGQFFDDPTLSCGADKETDNSKLGTALTDKADYEATCCMDVKKCSSHSCDSGAGWIPDTNKDDDKCWGGVCSDALCCKADPEKCRGYTAVACKADEEYDAKMLHKAGESVADDDEYKAKCCVATATCQEAKDFVIAASGQASSDANTNSVVALVLASTSALAFRGM